MSVTVTTGLLKQIDYTSVDIASIKQSMLARIPQICPEWTDNSESDFGIVLVELFAGIGDMLKTYQDATMNEGFIDTVKTRDAMSGLCALIGYQLSNASAATVYVLFSGQVDPLVTPEIRVPQGTQLSIQASDSSYVYFETSQDVYIELPVNTLITAVTNTSNFTVNDLTGITPGSQLFIGGQNAKAVTVQTIVTGSNNVTITSPLDAPINTGDKLTSVAGIYSASGSVFCYEGQTRYQEVLGYSNGYPNLQFILSFPNVLDDNSGGNVASSTSPNQIALFVDEGAGQTIWTEIADFALAGATDSVYTTSIDEYGYTTLYFGDNKNGRTPTAGAQIAATYRTGGGSRGKIGNNSILLLTSSIPGITQARTTTAGSGGADAETLDHARAAAPASLTALKRAVTAPDFETLTILADPSVIAAQVTVLDWNTANISVLTNSMTAANPTLSPATQANIANYIAPKMMVTQTLTLSAVGLVSIYIRGNLYVKTGSSQAGVLASVQNVLLSYFTLGQLKVGQNVNLSSIEYLIQSIPGVDHFDMLNLSTAANGNTIGDITITPGSVAILPANNLSVTAYGGF